MLLGSFINIQSREIKVLLMTTVPLRAPYFMPKITFGYFEKPAAM